MSIFEFDHHLSFLQNIKNFSKKVHAKLISLKNGQKFKKKIHRGVGQLWIGKSRILIESFETIQ